MTLLGSGQRQQSGFRLALKVRTAQQHSLTPKQQAVGQLAEGNGLSGQNLKGFCLEIE
jgi:hypothetical protein